MATIPSGQAKSELSHKEAVAQKWLSTYRLSCNRLHHVRKPYQCIRDMWKTAYVYSQWNRAASLCSRPFYLNVYPIPTHFLTAEKRGGRVPAGVSDTRLDNSFFSFSKQRRAAKPKKANGCRLRNRRRIPGRIWIRINCCR